MSAPDGLRPPSPFDPSAGAYKDWLHLNVLDHESGIVGLVNLSLHGDPGDERSRALGTALFHVPDAGWVGNVEVRGISEAALGPASIGLEQTGLAVHGGGTVLASARFPDDELVVELTATAAVPPIDVEERMPLSSGWVSWYVISRLAVSGVASVSGRRLDLGRASAYHDHNWGRWHWGEGVRWEWGCFLAPAPGPAFVLGRTRDSRHRIPEEPVLIVHFAGRRRTFRAAAVEIGFSGVLERRPRRLPGALAALHQDRTEPRLPRTLGVRADDGRDRVELEFTARAAAQVIAGDPVKPGYGFIH
ncbi:MAG TPA: hypothetical protein VHF23_05285, partial [Gaiellaceae bacterium]|nr:hypothetical protein [Gaiellaceae bacterium]